MIVAAIGILVGIVLIALIISEQVKTQNTIRQMENILADKSQCIENLLDNINFLIEKDRRKGE